MRTWILIIAASWGAAGCQAHAQTPANPIPDAPAVAPASVMTSSRPYAFTFTGANRFADRPVLEVVANDLIDGRAACHVNFVPSGASGGTIELVDDRGAGGPYSTMTIPGSGSVSNSQCSISGAESSLTVSGNTLTLTLAIAFSRSSGWQPS